MCLCQSLPCMRVVWKVHRLTMMQWLNLTKCGLFFNIYSLPCGPHTSSIGVVALGFLWYRSCHPVPQKSPQLQIWPHYLSDAAFQPSLFFNVGKQKIVRWCQIRRVWSLINQFKATVMHSSHCNHRLVCRSIVSVKQDSLLQFSRPLSLVLLFKVLNYLSNMGISGRKQCS